MNECKVHPAAAAFPPITGEAFKAFVADVAANGVRYPIVVHDGCILDGINRYRAARAAGVDCPTQEYAGDDPVGFVISANLQRRDLKSSQRAMIAADLANMRQGERTDLPQKCGKLISQKQAAMRLSVGERNVQHARKVRSADPAVADLVVAGTVNLHEANKLIKLPSKARPLALAAVRRGDDLRAAVRTARKLDYNARLRVAKPKALEGTYRIIYADPPWKYVGLNKADEYGHAEAHYDCLTDQQICDYRPGDGRRTVKELVDKDAVLFLWVTAPLLKRCFPIIESWGFEYKAQFIWDKIDHVMGFYNSVRHEHLLIATKGSCTPDINKLSDSVVSIKRAEHSKKPQEFYDIIESMYDHGRKLEIFARSGREGWDSVGNELFWQEAA